MTLEERAVLSELAVPEAQEERAQEEHDAEEAVGLTKDESATWVAAPTLVSLSETEDESTLTAEAHTELIDTPSWSSNAKAAPLSSTLTALTLASALLLTLSWTVFFPTSGM